MMNLNRIVLAVIATLMVGQALAAVADACPSEGYVLYPEASHVLYADGSICRFDLP